MSMAVRVSNLQSEQFRCHEIRNQKLSSCGWGPLNFGDCVTAPMTLDAKMTLALRISLGAP
jgi:hypothetical protein